MVKYSKITNYLFHEMLNGDQLSMPFVNKNLISQPEVEIERAIRSQNNLYNKFDSQRNAGRITHYFIIHRSTQIRNAISCIEFAFLIILTIVFLILLRISFKSDADKIENEIFASIFDQIDGNVQNILDIPTFFVTYLSTFISIGQLPQPSIETAYFYASILNNAHFSSFGHVNWWKIGIPNGGLIAVVANTSSNSKWCYVSSENEDYGSFYEWETNSEGRNDLYPFSGGVKTGYYNTTSHYWYKTAISSNTTKWTNLYYEIVPEQSTIRSAATFSAVSSVWNQDKLICVISIDIRLRYIQDFLRSIQVPSNSSLVITSSDGSLISFTSSRGEPLFDSNFLISDTIQDIDDPAWSCISRSNEFRTIANFTIECYIDDSSYTYNVFQSIIPFSEQFNWTLYAAIRSDGVHQSGRIMYSSQYVTPSIVCFAIIIIVYCISRLFTTFIISLHSKLLLSQKHNAKHHVVDSGVYQGLSQLQKVATVHSISREFAQDLFNRTRKKLQNSPHNLYFNYGDFFDQIADQKVREKIINIYKVNQYVFKSQQVDGMNNYESVSNSQIDSVDSFIGSKNTRNSSSCLTDNDDSIHTSTSDMNIDKSSKTISSNYSSSDRRESEVDIWNQESRSKYIHRSNYLEETLANLPNIDINRASQHQNIRNLNATSAINTIKNIGVGYNVQHQQLFDVNKLKEFLQSFLSTEIPLENLFLTVDSFDLYNQFIRYFGSSMFCDQDMIMSGYIALLAYHAAMKQRLDQSKSLIDRYFIRNKNDILYYADIILVHIAKFRTSDICFDNQRWEIFTSYVHSLCEITPIHRHIETFQKCRFFIKPSMIFRKLLYDRSMVLLSFFYLTSTVSFLINTPSFVEFAHSKLIVDRKTNKKFSEQFLYCLNNVYLDRLMKTLSYICGNTFIRKLTLPI